MSTTNLRAGAYASVWSSVSGHAMPPYRATYRDTNGPARAVRTAIRAR